MLLCAKKRGDCMQHKSRSLSSYIKDSRYNVINKIASSVMPMSSATITNNFGTITVGYNNQFNFLTDSLNVQKNKLAQTVQQKLFQDANYKGSRNAGVKLAWQYEKADIEMGGNGSANWTPDEKNQILNSKTGTVSGAEGHHQKNVVDHPKYQANPDNIKFYKTKQEHLQEGHNGNFQNESDASFIDKNKMLENTNHKRVFFNEIKGASISAAIGFGVALTISAVVELAIMGIEAVDVNDLVLHSLRSGLEGGMISSIVYCSGRMVSSFMQKHGIDLLTKVGTLINYAVVGTVSIVLMSTIQFIKMKINGAETSEAFRQVGKNVLYSTSILAVSIIAQGLCGGYAGLIVSTSVGLIILSANVVNSSYERKLNNRIREFAIEEYKPILIRG